MVHRSGLPLSKGTSGGTFCYHFEDNMVAIGLIIYLDYSNPHLSPFDEFQRMMHHPEFSSTLKGGTRLGYGARAITKGGWNSLIKMSVPEGLVVGCNAGTFDAARIKGTHTAMKSGMIAAEILAEEFSKNRDGGKALSQYHAAFKNSWAGIELKRNRSFGSALHKFGAWLGGAYNWIDQTIFRRTAFTIHHNVPDHRCLNRASMSKKMEYPKHDSVLSFDMPSSVFLSDTYHEEDIACRLILKDASVPIETKYKFYDSPETRYCPAGVYEIIHDVKQMPALQINSQNRIHCKTCDINDPTQNIVWIAPEGRGGPSYTNM